MRTRFCPDNDHKGSSRPQGDLYPEDEVAIHTAQGKARERQDTHAVHEVSQKGLGGGRDWRRDKERNENSQDEDGAEDDGHVYYQR